MRNVIFPFLIVFSLHQSLSSQDKTLQFDVPKHSVGINFSDFIIEMERASNVKFFYLEEWTDDILINQSYVGQSINSALNEILKGRPFDIKYIYNYGIIILKNPSEDRIRKELLTTVSDYTKKIIIGDSMEAEWGAHVRLTGAIIENTFSKPLPNVSIFAHEQEKGTSSDAYGKFSIELPVGTHLLSFKALNFEDQYFLVSIFENGNMDLAFEESPLTLDEIIINDNAASENFETTTAGKVRLTARDIETIPSLLGEIDVIKSIQILPGVNSVGEGSAGFNVRGGSADQNLILLDESIIFNPNHLFGFFSAFHPDAVQDVTFYRGAIPVEYGGRISSVLDVRQKKGDSKKFSGSGGLGMVSSRLLLEGPILKDKLSLLIAGRSSYSDWLLNQVNDDNVRNSSAFFYDVTGKIAATLDSKNSISATFYASQDRFKFADDTIYFWSNKSVSIIHDRVISENLTHHTSLSASRYNYEVRDEDLIESFSWRYSINTIKLKSFVNWQLSGHDLTIGLDATRYDFARGKLEPLSSNSAVEFVKLDNDISYEVGAFISDEIQRGRLTIIPGLRLSGYGLFGPHDSYRYNENAPIDDTEIIGLNEFDKGELAQSYFGIEPRISAKYDLNNSSFLKFAATRTFQYIHLISNTTTITPIDSWVPSSEFISPQRGNQVSVGFFKRMSKLGLSASAEAFYKHIDNLTYITNGGEFVLKQNIETELVSSIANIHGAEFSLIKEGRLNGQINYTYTSSRRKTETDFKSRQINNNTFFPANYDQPHNVKLNAKYDISRRHVLSFNFNLASGRPLTTPSERFEVDGITIGNFPERNNARLPLYHRLDVSFLIRSNHKKNKRWEGSWSLTIFNVYSRRNAYSIFFREDQDGFPQAFQLSILGSALPAITYNFKIK